MKKEVDTYENMWRYFERQDKWIKKGYSNIRSSRDISIIEGDQYIRESQSARSLVGKRYNISS